MLDIVLVPKASHHFLCCISSVLFVHLTVAVLDEADRILDMGFAQTMNAIVENLPTERQTLLFSATQTKYKHTSPQSNICYSSCKVSKQQLYCKYSAITPCLLKHYNIAAILHNTVLSCCDCGYILLIHKTSQALISDCVYKGDPVVSIISSLTYCLPKGGLLNHSCYLTNIIICINCMNYIIF